MRAPTADTGHLLVQLTQSGGHLSRPCSPPHSTHRASTAPLTETGGWTRWHGGGGRRQAGSAEEAPRPGSSVLMEWFIMVPSHKAGGGSTHQLQAPDRHLPRAHANSATWSSANTGRPRRHRTRDTGRGTRLGKGSQERGLVSPTLMGRTGKIRFVLLVKCPFSGYFLLILKNNKK